MPGTAVSIDVLVIRLGAKTSLDFVRKRDERLYLVVLADRDAIGGRRLIRLPYDDARACARFLLQLEEQAQLTLPMQAPCAAVVVRDVQRRCFTFSFERLGPIEERWRAHLPFGSASRVARFLAAPPALPLPAPADVVGEDPALAPTYPEGVPEPVVRERSVIVTKIQLPPREDGD